MSRKLMGMLLILMLFGCAHTKVEYWDKATGKKTAEYSQFAVFRNDVRIVDKNGAIGLSIDVNRPGLSDNGLEALKIAPALADEIGHTILGTQALDSLAEGAAAKLEHDVLKEAIKAGSSN